MTGRVAAVAALALMLGVQTHVRADHTVAAAPPSAGPSGVERYHYTISARIRPLVVFWLTRSGVGAAVVTRRQAPGEASYSLLIGSDPDRTPMRVNRWGYIEEEIRGAEAHLIGLMTESDEESIEQAEANIRKQPTGQHPFKVIQATIDGDHASSRVTSIATPEDYTFRQMRTVLGLALRGSSDATSRVVRLPPGTRPGFLAALTDSMHAAPATRITYVYHGRLYELRQTHTQKIPNLEIARASFGPATAADFVIVNMQDGEETRFSMTYGTGDRFPGVPLKVSYQPRWWMRVDLAIDNTNDVSSPAAGVEP
jgi:hypothetical protein